MEQDEHVTPVIFRKEQDGSITAVFPTMPWDTWGHQMTIYCHVGQHGAASFDWYNGTSKPQPHEYVDLMRELEGFGYKFKVYQRWQPSLMKRFRQNARAMQCQKEWLP